MKQPDIGFVPSYGSNAFAVSDVCHFVAFELHIVNLINRFG